MPAEGTAISFSDVLVLPSVEYSERRALPDEPGVYFAVVNGERIEYVGCTYSIRARWRCHNKRRDLHRLGDVRVHYLPVAEDQAASFIEQDVIELFRPSLNVVPARWGTRPDPGQWLPAALERFKATRREPGRPKGSKNKPRPAEG